MPSLRHTHEYVPEPSPAIPCPASAWVAEQAGPLSVAPMRVEWCTGVCKFRLRVPETNLAFSAHGRQLSLSGV